MSDALIQPGAKVAGKYRIIRPLGEGGMGMVYLARHELLDRTVAIKVLHARLEHRELAVKRFQREIKAMAMVQNPYIAQAVDAGVLESGALYLAMEYLEGRNLRAELKLRRAIPYPEAVAYVMQACAGVGAVHDVSIIHRDLKPQNLFLTALQGARCIKVVDFGIAKFIDGPDAALTESEVSVGTPLYMAPEQLTQPEAISRQTDVWGLAVVLYELIAGVSPFAANTPGAVVAAVVLQDPVPLSSVVPDVPKALARVVAKALSKLPAERPGGVREFAAELAPFGMPVDRVVVASPTRSLREMPALQRVRSRPELAACIQREVEAFDSGDGPGSSGERPHLLRELPSLAKLSIPPPDSGSGLESLGLSETTEQPALVAPALPGSEPRTSAQPTTILHPERRASESLQALGPRSKATRYGAVVALGLLVLSAGAGAAFMHRPRAASSAAAVESAERDGVAGSDALMLTQVVAPLNTSPPSAKPKAHEGAPRTVATDADSTTSGSRADQSARSAAVAQEPVDQSARSAAVAQEPVDQSARSAAVAQQPVELRVTKSKRSSAATRVVPPPTIAASSAPNGKPLHL